MNVLFVSGVAVITADPAASARFYVDALGLPLADDDGYRHSNEVSGVKHFGVWPVSAASQACFGTDTWPSDVPVLRRSSSMDDGGRGRQVAAGYPDHQHEPALGADRGVPAQPRSPHRPVVRPGFKSCSDSRRCVRRHRPAPRIPSDA
jgi:catechol 2,3-dioxygenase-like lactoylglutathione lyase family enzyme